MKRSKVPGLSLGIVRIGSSGQSFPDIEFGSWGTMSEHGANVTADTLFNIGSCSKAFLAVTMGILMEDFRLGQNNTPLPAGLTAFDWNTRISDLLPESEWGLEDEWATKEANVGDILSHVSGLPRHDFAWNYADSTLDVVRRLRHLKMTHGLRMQWDYNNQMYILGSHIISRYAGKPYTEYATERVFNTLHLNSTTFEPKVAENTGNLSHGWSYTGRRIPLWFGSDASEMLSGPGGVISSARDMTRWITALLPGVRTLRPIDASLPARVLSDVTEARAIVYSRSPLPGISILAYGMGWMRMSIFGNEIVFHSGAIPGFTSTVMLLPRENAGVVALANSDDLFMVNQVMAMNVVNTILGLPLLPERPDSEVYLQKNTAGFLPAVAFQGYPRRGSHSASELHKEDAVETAPRPQTEIPLPLEPFAGTYSNLGYGNLTFCAPTTASAYCDRVRAAFELTHTSNQTRAPAPALLAEWPRLLATHIRLAQDPLELPSNTLSFWMTTHYMFPEGYGSDRSPFDYELFPIGNGLHVECATTRWTGEVVGCGMFLSEGTYARRKPDLPLREQADVWFEKIV
ncbi:beta-lactamase/transpeptidase-like protein [Lenzites betulinus]|nr:beta-lactamase/transpeptidase-like protein [Lenzites betulinus]